MLRKTISRFGMVSAGVAVGAIMAISPVFAQGTTPSSPSTSSTLLASILAAAVAAGLNAEQTTALADVVAEITPNEVGTANDVEDEDELDEDDTEPATAAATAQVTKHEVKVTTAAAVTKSSEESKSDD